MRTLVAVWELWFKMRICDGSLSTMAESEEL
jgi:hypothetical protein